mgnify:CR=1 FL=1
MKNTPLPVFAAMLQGIKSRNIRLAYNQSRMIFCAERFKPHNNRLKRLTNVNKSFQGKFASHILYMRNVFTLCT